MRENPKSLLVQLAADVAIPLLGFYSWDWSLYFILLFLLLDGLAKEVTTWFRVRKLIHLGLGTSTSTLRMQLVAGLVGLLCLVGLSHLAVWILHPDTQFGQAFWQFLSYTEMGIPQGLLLIPLVALMAQMELKVQFSNPAMYQHLRTTVVAREHLQNRLILLVGALIGIVFISLVSVTDALCLGLIIVGSVLFRVWVYRSRSISK